jgi:hypothetical protein
MVAFANPALRWTMNQTAIDKSFTAVGEISPTESPFVSAVRALQRPFQTSVFTLTLVGVLFYCLYTGQITGTEALAAISGPVGIIVGFLFGERAGQKKAGG